MSPRRSRRYVGTEMALGWWHCHQDVVTAIPVALGGERCLEFPPRAASQHLIFIFSSECFNILFFFFFLNHFLWVICAQRDTDMMVAVKGTHACAWMCPWFICWGGSGCPQGTGGPRVLSWGPHGSPGRQQVALHCHQTGHTWHCAVTNTCDAALSLQGTRMMLRCHRGEHKWHHPVTAGDTCVPGLSPQGKHTAPSCPQRDRAPCWPWPWDVVAWV